MIPVRETNLGLIRHVAGYLGDLRERAVFLGGVVAAILITERAAPDVRFTFDVDFIVEITSQSEYVRFAHELRTRGFTEEISEGSPLGRWQVAGVTVDVVPTNEAIFGLGNHWYPYAWQSAMRVELADGMAIKVVNGPCFLAIMIEAFWKRGRGDFLFSQDLEDIITLIDGRPELVHEIRSASDDMRVYLMKMFSSFLANPSFQESLSRHLCPDWASQSRIPIILARMRKIVDGHYICTRKSDQMALLH